MTQRSAVWLVLSVVIVACQVHDVSSAPEQRFEVSKQGLYSPPSSHCGTACSGTCISDDVFGAIARASKTYNLPRWFYYAVVRRESSFCRSVTNKSSTTCTQHDNCALSTTNSTCMSSADCPYSRACGSNGRCETGRTCSNGFCTDCGKGLTQLTPPSCTHNGGNLGTPYPYDLTSPDNTLNHWINNKGLNLGGIYSGWVNMNYVSRFASTSEAFDIDRNLERFTTIYAAPAVELWRAQSIVTVAAGNISRSGSTVTVTAGTSGYPHRYRVNGTVIMTSAGETNFPSGAKTVTAVTDTTFSYTEAGNATTSTSQQVFGVPPDEILRMVAYHWHYGVFEINRQQQGNWPVNPYYPDDPHGYLSCGSQGSTCSVTLPCCAGLSCTNSICQGTSSNPSYDNYVAVYRPAVENAPPNGDGEVWDGGVVAASNFPNTPPGSSISASWAASSDSTPSPSQQLTITGYATAHSNSASINNAVLDVFIYDIGNNANTHTLIGSSSQTVILAAGQTVNYGFSWTTPCYFVNMRVEVGVRASSTSATYLFYNSQALAPVWSDVPWGCQCSQVECTLDAICAPSCDSCPSGTC